MQRGKLNLIVDVTSLAIFLLVVSSGLVLHILLPPGSGRLPGEGGTHEEILVLWGLSRHQWGQIHFWVSIALLSILTLHIGLHWRFFNSLFRRGTDPVQRRRLVLGVSGAVGVLLFAAAPLLSPVKTLQVNPNQTKKTVPGAELFERECRRCHADMAKLPPIPEGERGENLLREAQPPGPHSVLKTMSKDEIGELIRYLRQRR